MGSTCPELIGRDVPGLFDRDHLIGQLVYAWQLAHNSSLELRAIEPALPAGDHHSGDGISDEVGE